MTLGLAVLFAVSSNAATDAELAKAYRDIGVDLEKDRKTMYVDQELQPKQKVQIVEYYGGRCEVFKVKVLGRGASSESIFIARQHLLASARPDLAVTYTSGSPKIAPTTDAQVLKEFALSVVLKKPDAEISRVVADLNRSTGHISTRAIELAKPLKPLFLQQVDKLKEAGLCNINTETADLGSQDARRRLPGEGERTRFASTQGNSST